MVLDLYEPEEVTISLSRSQEPGGPPEYAKYSCKMALDSMSGVNYVTERLVADIQTPWPAEVVSTPWTQEPQVELGDSSQVNLHNATAPLNIIQSSPWGDFQSSGVRAVVVPGGEPVFTAGRPLLDEWGLGPRDAMQWKALSHLAQADQRIGTISSLSKPARRVLTEHPNECLPVKV